MKDPDTGKPPWYRRYAFWILLAIAGYFLWMEHRAHVIAYLPLVLLGACVGMHFLMHGAHGRGAHGIDRREGPKRTAGPDEPTPSSDSAAPDCGEDVR